MADSQVHDMEKIPENTTPSSRQSSLSGHTTPNGGTIDAEKAIQSSLPDKSQDPRTVRPIHGWKWTVACLAMYLTAFLYGLDTTIAADVQAEVVKSLGEIQKLAWIGTGFPLGSVVVILPLGYAYGLFEIKALYLTSVVVFEVGSVICGAAPNMNAMIVGRIIAGAGGAGMYLGLLNYISSLTTSREQSLFNSMIGMVWGAGCICGPLVGGGFSASSVGWRFSFYINLILAAAFAPGLIIYLPRVQPKTSASFWAKIRSLDWVGIILIAAVYVLYTAALTFGGAQWSWTGYKFAITITFFGLTLIAFIVQQGFSLFTTAAQRLFPTQLLASRSMLLFYTATASAISSVFINTYYIPLFFQFARGDSAIVAAVRLLPFITINITFILLQGGLMPVFGYYQPWYIVSGIFQIIGGSLMYTYLREETSNSMIYGISVLTAIGAGCSVQASYAVAATKTIQRGGKDAAAQIPSVIGFINLAQLGSIVIALTISGTIFQNLAYQNLQAAFSSNAFTSEQLREALAGTQAAIFQQWNAQERQAAVRAIIAAMDKVFILGIVAGVVSLLSGLAMRREKLFSKAADTVAVAAG